jgi:hypothetical protein
MDSPACVQWRMIQYMALGRADPSQCAPKDQNYACTCRQRGPRPCGDARSLSEAQSVNVTKGLCKLFQTTLCCVIVCLLNRRKKMACLSMDFNQ